jgi:hypothetical protein
VEEIRIMNELNGHLGFISLLSERKIEFSTVVQARTRNVISRVVGRLTVFQRNPF